MRLTKLYFENYKAFAGEHELELRPLTIIIGRNNSGKSALTRLPLLLKEMFTEGYGTVPPIKAGGQRFGDHPLDLVTEKLTPGRLSLGTSVTSKRSTETGNILIELFNQWYPENDQHELDVRLQIGVNKADTPNEIEKLNISISPENININVTQDRHLKTYTIKTPNQEIKNELLRWSKWVPSSTRHNEFSIMSSLMNPDQDTPLARSILHINMVSELLQRAIPPILHIPSTRVTPQKSVAIWSEQNLFTDPREMYRDIITILYASKNKDQKLFNEVSDWYKTNLGGWELKLVGDAQGLELRVTRPQRDDYDVHILDAGSALAQTLPIVVMAHAAKHATPAPLLMLIEEPESHLHPGAHGALTDLIVNMIHNKPPHAAIVETHSEVFCLRVQRWIAEGTLSPDDAIIYWIDSTEGIATPVPIFISEKGETYIKRDGKRIRYWPRGVFSEDFEEIQAIQELANN